MKVNVNQKMYDEFGEFVKAAGKPDVTLRDVIVNSILVPLQDDDDKKKYTKYEIFKKLAEVLKDGMVELSSEEISLIKNVISKVQGPLFTGESTDMLEGKFDPAPFNNLKLYFAQLKEKKEESV